MPWRSESTSCCRSSGHERASHLIMVAEIPSSRNRAREARRTHSNTSPVMPMSPVALGIRPGGTLGLRRTLAIPLRLCRWRGHKYEPGAYGTVEQPAITTRISTIPIVSVSLTRARLCLQCPDGRSGSRRRHRLTPAGPRRVTYQPLAQGARKPVGLRHGGSCTTDQNRLVRPLHQPSCWFTSTPSTP
jgi:hypothetical protein